MLSGVVTRLRRLIRDWSLRQALVALCITAFLAANVAHASQHAGELLPQSAHSLASHAAPDGPQPAADHSPAIDACAVCHWIAAPLASSSLETPPVRTMIIAATPAATRAHPPAVDFRPPIA
jgi:hypothetical protein